MLDARLADIDKRDADASARALELNEEAKALKKAEARLAKDRKSLDELAASIREQEGEARSGFQALHEKWRSELAEEESRRRADLDQLVDEAREAREAATQAAHAARAKALEREADRERAHRTRLDEEFETLRTELQDRALRLAEREAELRHKQEDLAEDEADLRATRQALHDRVEQLAQQRIAHAEGATERLKRQVDDLGARNDALEQELVAARAIFDKIGETPRALRDLKTRLTDENAKLREELARASDGVGREHVAELESRLDDAQRRLRDIERERDRAVLEANAVRLSQVELQAERDKRSAYQTANAALSQALEELREQYDRVMATAEKKSPFRACVQMDGELATPRDGAGFRLDRLVSHLQHAMALATTDEDREVFLYTEEDIRAFVGGLAMGQLLLLQGVSGTGKTNLPIRFARAVGGNASTVSVQAGWRDRYDLLGSYNAFSRVFDERPFLKALYAAQTPAWRNLVNIIVLDEMNLSYFEQYGADILSALERPAGQRTLTLHSSPLPDDQLPAALTYEDDAGVVISLPNNVWLVGTANEDETTKAFADKTFDRAQVVELERRGDFRPSPRDVEPLSADKLRGAFDRAIASHGGAAASVQSALDEDLAPYLREHFRARFGSRITRHVRRYVPVNVALGGTAGEAFDHLVSTQLLRKVRGRFDTRVDQIDELAETIRLIATERFQVEPTRTLEALKEERKWVEDR